MCDGFIAMLDDMKVTSISSQSSSSPWPMHNVRVEFEEELIEAVVGTSNFANNSTDSPACRLIVNNSFLRNLPKQEYLAKMGWSNPRMLLIPVRYQDFQSSSMLEHLNLVFHTHLQHPNQWILQLKSLSF